MFVRHCKDGLNLLYKIYDNYFNNCAEMEKKIRSFERFKRTMNSSNSHIIPLDIKIHFTIHVTVACDRWRDWWLSSYRVQISRSKESKKNCTRHCCQEYEFFCFTNQKKEKMKKWVHNLREICKSDIFYAVRLHSFIIFIVGNAVIFLNSAFSLSYVENSDPNIDCTG